MRLCGALLGEDARQHCALAAVLDGVDGDAARRTVDGVAHDLAVCPAQRLDGGAAHVFKDVVADDDVAVRRVMYRGVRADASRTVGKAAVLHQHVLHRQILGACVIDIV